MTDNKHLKCNAAFDFSVEFPPGFFPSSDAASLRPQTLKQKMKVNLLQNKNHSVLYHYLLPATMALMVKKTKLVGTTTVEAKSFMAWLRYLICRMAVPTIITSMAYTTGCLNCEKPPKEICTMPDRALADITVKEAAKRQYRKSLK